MSFEEHGETVIGAHSLEDLKLIYRILHQDLRDHPELMETHFLTELQAFLHQQAQKEGIDGTDHGAWDSWLAEAHS